MRVEWDVVTDLVRALAWPAVAGIGLVLFRESIRQFLKTVATRANKLGLFNLSIELAEATARQWSAPAIEEFRNPAGTAIVQDSSGSILREMVGTPADYVVVDLGDGRKWLTSRLYIMATMLRRMRNVRQVVFVADPAKRFVGTAAAPAVRWLLARRYAWLEQAYVGALHDNVWAMQNIVSPGGGLPPSDAASVVRNFLTRVQQRPPKPQPEWETFTEYSEHATWVTPALLGDVLGDALETNPVKRDPTSPEATALKVLRRSEPFVAIVDDAQTFQRLIDRQALVEKALAPQLYAAS